MRPGRPCVTVLWGGLGKNVGAGMAAWSEMGSGARVAVVSLGVTGLAVLSYGVTRPAQPVVTLLPAPLAALPDAPPVAEAPVVERAIPVPPSFDTWRVEADGAAVVAGRTVPGAVVTIIVDGVPVADAAADARGAFVALFTLLPNPNPSLMTLEATLAEGSTLASAQSVALSAIAGPVVADASDVPAMIADAQPATPDSVLITQDGARVVQVPGRAAGVSPDGVRVDAIAYSAAGDVQLSGQGQAGARVSLYLDDAPVALVPVGPDGTWSITLTDTPPGLYTLRADQIDDQGRVTARFETPFQRETREALAALAAAATQGKVAATPPMPETAVAPAPQTGAGLTPSVASAETPAPEAAPVAESRVSEGVSPSATANTPGEQPPALVVAPETVPTAPAQALVVAPASVASAAPVAVAGALTEPAPEAAAPATPPSVSITVQPGFTLWGIARQQLGDGVLYVQVFEVNKDRIKNPDLIYPGQVFVLPTR